MVIHKYLQAVISLCVFLLFCGCLDAIDAVQISVQVNQNVIYENLPIKGTILITHPKADLVEIKSFIMEKKPLKVDFIKAVDMTDSSLVTSIYEFEMSGKPAGLHLVPEVSVKVGKKVYTSISTGFQVKSGPSTSATYSPQNQSKTPQQSVQQQSNGSKNVPILKLEAFYDGPDVMYPGGRSQVGYRYYFNDNISITEETLPLLDADGFKKIGSKVISDQEVQGWSVREIKQEIEAIKPGSYLFPAAKVEGYPYRVDRFGKKQVLNQKLTTESSPITIDVRTFPEKDVPKSFTGAIGQYVMEVKMITPSEVRVGDKITLIITFTGTGQYNTIRPPELCCIPGFSGLFHTTDIPPIGKEIQGGVSYTIDLRPLTSSIKMIPSIEFTYFDPIPQKYVTIQSNPIPVTVKPLPKEQKVPEIENNSGKETAVKPIDVAPIEIGENYPLKVEDVHPLPFGTWWSLVLVPLGIGILMLQKNMKHVIEKVERELPKETSERLFRLAMDSKVYDSDFFFLLNRSFLLLLKEKGVINDIEIAPHALGKESPSSDVRNFLLELEQRRFSKSAIPFTDSDKEKAINLFHRLERTL